MVSLVRGDDRTARAAPSPLRRPRWALALALAALLASGSCRIVHTVVGNRLTGTCSGACDHYVACKPAATIADRDRCLKECPDALGDRDARMAYESLSCSNAVEYVDGEPAVTARDVPR